MFILIALVLPLVAYATLLLLWQKSWHRANSFVPTTQRRPMSVVVALHNEEHNVEKLIASLLAQSRKCDEVIFVCDHCTDATESILRKLTVDNFKVVINHREQGKKNAQRLGVELAQHDIVAVTDADCEPPTEWFDTVSAFHAETDVDVVIAPVAMRRGKTQFSAVAELEFLALQMCTAATALRGKPIMCNGANLSFRRDKYIEHNSKSHFASGDDMFLLLHVKEHNGQIAFLKNSNAIVSTAAPTNIATYLRQRTRWLRKSTGYTDNMLIITACVVLLANLVCPILLIMTLFDTANFVLLASAFCAKLAVEASLLLAARHFWSVRIGVFSLMALAVSYPVLVVAIALLSVFRSHRKW